MRIALRVPSDPVPTGLAVRGFLEVKLEPTLVRRGPFVDVGAKTPRRATEVYGSLFDALVRVDVWCIKKYQLERLYSSDVVYCREPVGEEVWQSSASIFATGWGDCEDLACHRVAELTLKGKPARVRLTHRTRSDSSRMYHVTVHRGDGCAEDPSFRLGMRGRD